MTEKRYDEKRYNGTGLVARIRKEVPLVYVQKSGAELTEGIEN
jgi:hypothetical protein